MTALKLRRYQEDAIEAVLAALRPPGAYQRVAVVAATGLGKTIIFSHLAKEWLYRNHDGSRVVILAHRDELIGQA
ncbi:MAG TPA: DEAD/DEAH box helicase family protein, partial [Armatimonadota bacterium]|nr:DEAD/DEAH box helicase family protein [Armatimonadota bacterium]